MNRKLATAAVTTAVGALVLTGCADKDRKRCDTSYIFITNGVYHYGSPTGPTIDRKHVGKDGKLKPGVSLSKDGKVNLNKSTTTTGGGSKSSTTGGSGSRVSGRR